MSFIGVICEAKYENYMKHLLSNALPNENVLILKEENIENFKNITFKTIAIFSNCDKIFEKKKIIKTMIEKAEYLIVNADDEINLDMIRHLDLKVITFGFHTKSTVTASSVTEDSILICVQRNIQDIQAREIEPQEILVQNVDHKITTNIMMGIVSILMIYCFSEIQIK